MRPSMLVAGHGTRHAAGVEAFHALVARLQRVAGDEYQVAGGFMELSRPSLDAAVDTLCAGGATHLVTVPLMLLAAGHGKGHIPGTLRDEACHRPGVTFSYGRPLGPHPVLLDLLTRRIDATLATGLGGAPRAGTTVVLAGQGSTDPDGNAELAKVARLLWEGRGYERVEVAYLSTTTPGLAESLDRAHTLGAARIVVAPHLLFPGTLSEATQVVTESWAANRPGVAVAVADVLGDCDELAALVAHRYQEALHGDIRMNCDTCLYRTPLPGLEHRVGEPQRPHDHAGHDHAGHDHGGHEHGGHEHGGHEHGGHEH